MELTPCGTYAAAQRHRHNGEPLCAPCREASTAYHLAYRIAHPPARKRRSIRAEENDGPVWIAGHEVHTRFDGGRFVYEVAGVGFAFRANRGDSRQIGRWWAFRGRVLLGPFDGIEDAIRSL